MRKFIEKRSKALLIVSLVSIVLFGMCIPELMHKAKVIALDTNTYNNSNTIMFDSLLLSIMMLVFILNIVGFIYKRGEFNFLATGLIIILLCMSIYVYSLIGNLGLIFLALLNIIGTMGQYTINKSK